MEKKFLIEMEGWLNVNWTHEFTATSISNAQIYAREMCLKCPVGVRITLWMEDNQGWEDWGTWERRVARRVDEFAKQEATVTETAKLAVEEALKGNGANHATSDTG